MKKSLLIQSLLLLSMGLGSQGAFALGKEESVCSDSISKSCLSTDPEVLAFRKEQVRQLYTTLIFPGPVEVMKDAAKANHLFQDGSVKGRVTPLGKFSDFNGVVEYFYALAANPNDHVFSVKINSLIGDEDQVAVNVNLIFCGNTNPDCDSMSDADKKKATLTETGTFKFNKQNRIIDFDLIIPNLGAAKDEKDPIKRATNIQNICAFLTIAHVSPITQELVQGGTCPTYFDSRDDFGKGEIGFTVVPNQPFLNCVAFMNSIPYGSYDRANSNTFTCRQTHALLTPLRPDYHCMHVAFDGGGKCVDFPYESYYDEMNTMDSHDSMHMMMKKK